MPFEPTQQNFEDFRRLTFRFLEKTRTSQQALIDAACPDGCATVTRGTLSKFLNRHSATLRLDFCERAIAYLETQGFWPPESVELLFPLVTDFFKASPTSDATETVLKRLGKAYAYYQWSSLVDGYVTIGLMEIEEHDGCAYVSVAEQQTTSNLGNPLRDETESYEGVGFARRGVLYILSRQAREAFPRFCLFDEYSGTQTPIPFLGGHVLKGTLSRGKSHHRSRAFMELIDAPETFEPRVAHPEQLDDYVIENLSRKR